MSFTVTAHALIQDDRRGRSEGWDAQIYRAFKLMRMRKILPDQ